MSVPGKVKSTRRMFGLENMPFVPPLSTDPTQEEIEQREALLEQRSACQGEEDKEEQWKAKLLEKVGTDCFGAKLDDFEPVAEEASIAHRLRSWGPRSLQERVQPYLDKASMESGE